MRITDLLDKRSISLDAAPADKKATLDMAVELMAKSGKLMDVEQYRAPVSYTHLGCDRRQQGAWQSHRQRCTES